MEEHVARIHRRYTILVRTVPHAIHIRVREFNDEEKESHKDQEEASG